MRDLLSPPLRSALPTPPKTNPMELTNDPMRAKLYELALQKGGGVGMGRRPDMPGASSVPQRAPLAPVDWSGTNAEYEKARPSPKDIDPKEVWLTGLLGAVAGFGDARPGERLGLTLGKMAGAGTMAGLQERGKQKDQKRQDEQALRAFEFSMAQNKQGQKSVDIGREDKNQDITTDNAMRVYDHGWRNYNAGVQWQQIAMEAQRGNAANAMARLGLLAQLTGQDREAKLRIEETNRHIASGNFAAAIAIAQIEDQRHNQDAQRSLQALTLLQGRPGQISGLDPGGQVGMIVQQSVQKGIPIPGIDHAALWQQARKQAGPQAGAEGPLGKRTVETIYGDLLMNELRNNPELMDNARRRETCRAKDLFKVGHCSE
jgi:hypothetical protein